MVGSPLQILVRVGSFPVDVGGDTIVQFSLIIRMSSIGRLLSFFDGECDAIVLLLNVLEQLVLILLSDVRYILPPEIRGDGASAMAFSSNSSMKRFARTSKMGNPMAMP